MNRRGNGLGRRTARDRCGNGIGRRLSRHRSNGARRRGTPGIGAVAARGPCRVDSASPDPRPAHGPKWNRGPAPPGSARPPASKWAVGPRSAPPASVEGGIAMLSPVAPAPPTGTAMTGECELSAVVPSNAGANTVASNPASGSASPPAAAFAAANGSGLECCTKPPLTTPTPARKAANGDWPEAPGGDGAGIAAGARASISSVAAGVIAEFRGHTNLLTPSKRWANTNFHTTSCFDARFSGKRGVRHDPGRAIRQALLFRRQFVPRVGVKPAVTAIARHIPGIPGRTEKRPAHECTGEAWSEWVGRARRPDRPIRRSPKSG